MREDYKVRDGGWSSAREVIERTNSGDLGSLSSSDEDEVVRSGVGRESFRKNISYNPLIAGVKYLFKGGGGGTGRK